MIHKGSWCGKSHRVESPAGSLTHHQRLITESNQSCPLGGSPGKLLLLGLGNDLLSDDAVGLRLAEAVAARLLNDGSITVLGSAEMGLSLLDLIAGFDELVLVDAIQTGQASPGFVHRFRMEDLEVLPALSPHFLGVGEVLSLGRRLGLSVPRRVRILAIEVLDPFTVSRQMTPALEAKFPDLVRQVLLELEDTGVPAGATASAHEPDTGGAARG